MAILKSFWAFADVIVLATASEEPRWLEIGQQLFCDSYKSLGKQNFELNYGCARILEPFELLELKIKI